jgi:hypothetical protein
MNIYKIIKLKPEDMGSFSYLNVKIGQTGAAGHAGLVTPITFKE